MERKTRIKVVEVAEEYYVAGDGTEFATAEQCLMYERANAHEETRSQRVNLLVKPSVNAKLDQMVADGVIKSKNDLVNFLLENYIAQQG